MRNVGRISSKGGLVGVEIVYFFFFIEEAAKQGLLRFR